MILYEYQCEKCGCVLDVYATMNCRPKDIDCHDCDGRAVQVIGASMVNMAAEDAAWLKTVTEVVDKDQSKPHCVEFVKNPTRSNYKNWMKKEGLRHLEPGEKTKPRQMSNADMQRLQSHVFNKFQNRNAITIGR